MTGVSAPTALPSYGSWPLAPEPQSGQLLDQIRVDGGQCTRCPLARSARSTVVYRGAERPTVLFVGQSPGAEEDAAGLPFVGASGKELDAKLTAPFPSYGITNILLHHPPKNRYDSAYGVACQPFLLRTIKAVAPRALVSLGNDAVVVLSRLQLDLPRFHLPHPAAMLYNPAMRVKWDSGWVSLRLWLAARGLT